jgi:tRNA(fMet)-specific endonuclease VapC
MILLDTDHLSVFVDRRDPRAQALRERLEESDDEIACSIVSVEELLRGWLAVIHRMRDVHRQLSAYDRLAHLFDVLRDWAIVRFDKDAADQFVGLRRQAVRIGSMDLKIASIALVNDALLLTANSRDFSQVPGLRCENWLQ